MTRQIFRPLLLFASLAVVAAALAGGCEKNPNPGGLLADTPPAITANPANQTVNAGSNVSFTAAASGNPAPTVQWQVSTDGGVTWTNISGATSTTLAISAAAAGQNGNEYRAVFTNTAGTATTTAATLTVDFAPTVTTNPANQTVNAGSNASFTAAASGNPAPTVQWQVSADAGATWTNISGATSTTLAISAAAGQNGNQYRAVFTNVVATATTTAATLTVGSPGPAITSIVPFIVDFGGPDLTLTVNGTGFANGSIVQFNGVGLTTSFVSALQLTAIVPAANTCCVGVGLVTVSDLGPPAQVSLSAVLTIALPSSGPGVTSLVSVATDGTQGNIDSFGFSLGRRTGADGSYAAFHSNANNLAPGINNASTNVLRRKTCLGKSPCAPATVLVDVANDGTISNGGGTDPSISDDGSVVAFVGCGDNLAPGVTPGTCHAYVHVFCDDPSDSTCVERTILIDKNASGNPANAAASQPAISANGELVAITTLATDLGGNPPGTYGEVYVATTCRFSSVGGCTPAIKLLSTDSAGNPANGPSFGATLSANGSRIALISRAPNMVAAGAPSGVAQVLFGSTCMEVAASPSCMPGLQLVSKSSTGTPGDGDSANPSLSNDGQSLTFDTVGNTLPPSVLNRRQPVAVTISADGQSLIFSPVYSDPSLTTDGQAPNQDVTAAYAGGDGRLIGVSTTATNAAANETSGSFKAVLIDTCGLTAPPNCVPNVFDLSQGVGGPVGNGDTFFPSISADGQSFAVTSIATNFLSTATNGSFQIFQGRTGIQVAACGKPTITSFSPGSIDSIDPTKIVRIIGTNFCPSAKAFYGKSVLIGGASQFSTTFISSTELDIAIPGDSHPVPKDFTLEVVNPAHGFSPGSVSNEATLPVL